MADIDEKEPYRVMIVDDSLVIRGIVGRIIQADPMIKVVKSVGNGQVAIDEVKKDDKIEVVILDIEMPIKDGLTALPEILAVNKNIQVIMSSTLTLQNAEISMKALALGASDYVTKPSSSETLNGDKAYQKDLIEKIKVFGNRARKNRLRAATTFKSRKDYLEVGTPTSVSTSLPNAKKEDKSVTLAGVGGALKTPGKPGAEEATKKTSLFSSEFTLVKPDFKFVPEIVAIGSSTGGPPALFKIFGEIKNTVKQPILITQHMPATFTKILAEHLERLSGKKVFEAENGMPIEPEKVYVAPGGFHMVVGKEGDKKVIKINSDPPENFCRPAVDPMFRSVAKYYGPKAFAVVLTGMGYDGSKGAKVILEAGGNVIAQDEATSVVWGMPGATAQLGVCCAVLPLSEISGYIKKVTNK